MNKSLITTLMLMLGTSLLYAENGAGPASAAAKPPTSKEITVTVSSTDGEKHSAENAIDKDESTRWSSNYTDQGWICLDLGKVKTIAGVDLLWETAYAKEYKIQVSTDGTSWTDAFVETDGKGDHEVVAFKNKLETRYIKMLGIQRASQYGYSLWEITPLAEIKAATATTLNEPTVMPDWVIGPFVRPPNPQPVIRPNPDSVFDCPMRNKPVNWEARHTFNPAAVVKDGKVFVLYRAEDNSSKGGIGSFTSRLGLAISEDGIHFTCEPKPVLFPDEDAQKGAEWTGGCEDPRLVEGPDGTYVVTYTQYAGRDLRYRLGLATSKDLRTWTKHGCPFTGTAQEGMKTKSAAIVQELRDGRLVAARIKGRFWMYFGVYNISLASSDDLVHWKHEKGGVLSANKSSFDSAMVESGCSPILTKDGIVMIYNGVTKSQAYVCGQALFSAEDPAKLVSRLNKPFFSPAEDWEKSGQYKAGTTFAEGLVFFKNQWFMYYGCADTFVGVATAPAAK